jgi:hypothetical protein
VTEGGAQRRFVEPEPPHRRDRDHPVEFAVRAKRGKLGPQRGIPPQFRDERSRLFDRHGRRFRLALLAVRPAVLIAASQGAVRSACSAVVLQP